MYGIFELGKHLEILGGKYLQATGWVVQQSPDGFLEKHISGKIDFFISRDELRKIPVEIKWLSAGIEKSWKEMLYSDKRWIRRYPAQIMIYMYLRASRYGLFLAFNKLNSKPSHIWIDFEDNEVISYIEGLLQKAERVWKAIEEKKPPDRISPEAGICLDCDFLTICEPPIYFGEGVKELENRDLIRILNRMELLKNNYDEYRNLDEQKKEILKGIENAVLGPYLIHGKKIRRKEYTVTVKATEYWKHKIVKINSLGQIVEVLEEIPIRKIKMEG